MTDQAREILPAAFQALMDFAMRAGAPTAAHARRTVWAEGSRLLDRLALATPKQPVVGDETLREAVDALKAELEHERQRRMQVEARLAVGDEPTLTAEEENELVERINANPNLHPVGDEPTDADVERVAKAVCQTENGHQIYWRNYAAAARAAILAMRKAETGANRAKPRGEKSGD